MSPDPSARCNSTVSSQRLCLFPAERSVPTRRKPWRSCRLVSMARSRYRQQLRSSDANRAASQAATIRAVSSRDPTPRPMRVGAQINQVFNRVTVGRRAAGKRWRRRNRSRRHSARLDHIRVALFQQRRTFAEPFLRLSAAPSRTKRRHAPHMVAHRSRRRRTRRRGLTAAKEQGSSEMFALSSLTQQVCSAAAS